ncbi:MAG: hypothetical protein JWO72_1584 [Caulobacteraceae bacterium]|nr:hypothetical protein [Caulobacteraceae bacterium]
MPQPQVPRLHEFSRSDDGARADALIVILFGQGRKAQAEDLAAQWAPSVPRGVFAGLELDLTARRIDLVALRALLSEAADKHWLQSQQVVLLGAGRAGQVAIHVVLLGVLPGAAVITLDLPLEAAPTILSPAPASVRMVQHSTPDDPRGERFHAVVEGLQRRQVNIRSMLLPDLDAVTQRATVRAAGAFLVELVANAGRQAPTAEAWP